MILASGSPRRRELLAQMGFAFRVETRPCDETLPEGIPPEEAVCMLAQRKGLPVCRAYPDALVVAADTLVALDGTVLGKPASPAQARQMLQSLSGREHQVLTGVYAALGDKSLCRAAVTQVRFRALTAQEIDSYVATGDPMDKAGAYGIQNRAALFVQEIRGNYDNVVGLPLSSLYEMICEILPGGERQALAMLGSPAGK